MTRGIRAWIYLNLTVGAIFVGSGIFAGHLKAQQPAPQKPPFQLLLEQQIGAQAVDAAMLRASNDQLQAIVAERDKTITGLKAELAEAKKEASK